MNNVGLAAAVFAIIAIGPAIAADINAPIERPITIKSEVSRGDAAAFDCFINMADPRDWLGFSQCILKIASDETRVNRITDAFQFGLYHGALIYSGMTRKAVFEVTKIDLDKNPNFAHDSNFYRFQSGKYQKILSLSDSDIVTILAPK